MPRKRSRGRPGDGSIYWSERQQRFVAEVTLGYDEHGARVKRVLVGPRGAKSDDDRLGLKDRLDRVIREKGRTKRLIRTKVTLKEYLGDWYRDKQLSAAARETYGWAIDSYIVPALGTVKLHALDRSHIKRFFSNLTLGDASREKIRTVLRAALQDAVTEHGLRPDNPADAVKLNRREAFSEIAVWNATEARKFLRTAKSTEYFPLFLLAIVGALGPAELFGIRWKDVDLTRGSVAIVANLTEVGGKLVLKETKTTSRRRSVALPKLVKQALQDRYKTVKPQPSDYVFTAPEGGPIRRSTFRQRVWQPLLKKAKVPAITLYGLRHSSASLMAAMGVPLLLASRAMGHSSIRLTADVYSHLFDESQREVAAKFDAFLRDL